MREKIRMQTKLKVKTLQKNPNTNKEIMLTTAQSMYIYITMGVTTLPILYDRPINYNQTEFSYICRSNINFQ